METETETGRCSLRVIDDSFYGILSRLASNHIHENNAASNRLLREESTQAGARSSQSRSCVTNNTLLQI